MKRMDEKKERENLESAVSACEADFAETMSSSHGTNLKLSRGERLTLLKRLESRLESSEASTRGLSSLLHWLSQAQDAALQCSLLDALSSILAKSSRSQFSCGEPKYSFPDAFILFGSSCDDGILIPPLQFSLLRGYSFVTLLSLSESEKEVSRPEAERILFKFLTKNGDGVKALVKRKEHKNNKHETHGAMYELLVCVKVTSNPKWQTARCDLEMSVMEWRHLIISHSHPYLASPTLCVYLDAVKVCETPLVYPTFEHHTAQNYVGQALHGRVASFTLFEGSLSDKQAVELFYGQPRFRVSFHNPDFALGKNNLPVTRKRTGSSEQTKTVLSKAGLATVEGIYDLRHSVSEVLRAANGKNLTRRFSPKSFISNAADTIKRSVSLSSTTSSASSNIDEQPVLEESGEIPFPNNQERIRNLLRRDHKYDDLPIVFTCDPRTCIGGEESLKGWQTHVKNGVMETITLYGKRKTVGPDPVIEPQPFPASKVLEKVAFGMPSRNTSVYARLVGDATAVFDAESHPSLEPLGGILPLLVPFVSFLPRAVQFHFHLFPFSESDKEILHTGTHFIHNNRNNTADLHALDQQQDRDLVLAKLILVLSEALSAREAYREDFIQQGGFQLLGWVLQHVDPSVLTIPVVKACLECILRVGALDARLRCDGFLYILFDGRIWSRAGPVTQVFWVQRLAGHVDADPLEVRIAVGVQVLLELLSICWDPSYPSHPNSKEGYDNVPDELASRHEERNEMGDHSDVEHHHHHLHAYLSADCVEPLVDIIRLMFQTKALVGDDPYEQKSSHSVDNDIPRIEFCDKYGPTHKEIDAILSFASRNRKVVASGHLLGMLATMFLPLVVQSRDWSPESVQVAISLYEAIDVCGGIDILLGIGSKPTETRLVSPNEPSTPSSASSSSFKLLNRLTGTASLSISSGTAQQQQQHLHSQQLTANTPPASPATPPTIGSADSELENQTQSQQQSQTKPTAEDVEHESFGLLTPNMSVPPFTRAAMLLLAGRMILLEERREIEAMLVELQSNPTQQESLMETTRSRREKQFGIILRSIMPVAHVASFRMEDDQVEQVSKNVSPALLDAIVSIILGTSASHEGVDDFAPHDDSLRLAMPEGLPVLGGLLAALSKADEETKSIAARDILLKLSLVLKASHAAREQVTSLPRWQTWLLPVMLLHEQSLDKNDDQSADYLLGEVAADLLCTLMEHETQREDDTLAEAKKLNRAQVGWASWQGFAEGTLRLTKEKERSKMISFLDQIKGDSEMRHLLPEVNALIEIRATTKSARVIRQTLERVWERLTMQVQACGLHENSVRNFLMTVTMAEETLLAELNLLRLRPISPGGVISSSSAGLFKYALSSGHLQGCGAKNVLDSKRETKWVDISLDTNPEHSQLHGFSQSSQSWIMYKYPRYPFKDPDEFPTIFKHRVVFYVVRSAFDMPELDPSGWTLFGRTVSHPDGASEKDQQGWVVLDRRTEVRFSSRYHAIHCWVQSTGFFNEYKIVFDPPSRRGKICKNADGTKVYAKLHVGEVTFFECDVQDWPRDPPGASSRVPTEFEVVRDCLTCNGAELERFVRLALQTVRFIRSVNTQGTSPRVDKRSYRASHDNEIGAQVHDLPKRGVVRFLGHILRHAAHFQVDLVEDASALARSFLADDLSTPSQGNRNLVLVLLHCIHHGLASLNNASDEGGPDSRIDALFATVAPILSDCGLLDAQEADAIHSVEDFLQSWRSLLAQEANKAVEREIEAEVTHRHVHFRVERNTTSGMAKKANPVEVAAYGAGRQVRPIGVPRPTKVRLQHLKKVEEDRVYTLQVLRVSASDALERKWRKLLERDEVLKIEHKRLSGATDNYRHKLYRLGSYIEPKLRVRNQLVRNPNGDPHFGAASGVADRLERKELREAEEKDQQPDPSIQRHSTSTSSAPSADTSPAKLSNQQVLLEASKELSEPWETFGAKLSKQISIADMSLMTKADEEEGDVQGEIGDINQQTGKQGSKNRREQQERDGDDENDDDDENMGKDSCWNTMQQDEKEQPTVPLISEKSEMLQLDQPGVVVQDDEEENQEQGKQGKDNRQQLSVLTFSTKPSPGPSSTAFLERHPSTSSISSAMMLSSPMSPGTPHLIREAIESRGRMTIQAWVNRKPDPTRGESERPWPSKGEVVIAASRAFLVRPEYEIPGRIIVSQEAVYFDPDQPDAEEMYIIRPSGLDKASERILHDGDLDAKNVERWTQELSKSSLGAQLAAKARVEVGKRRPRRRKVWLLGDIDKILLRRYRMRDSAFEMFIRGNKHESFFIDFDPILDCKLIEREDGELDVKEEVMRNSHWARNNIINKIWNFLPTDTRRKSQKPNESLRPLLHRYTRLWQERRMTNFEYLMRLNLLAGRSLCDLAQYPVFPWVLADYESETLNLSDPRVFRDLSKPMGALTEDRLHEARERYRTFDDPSTPKFHYGSHYSTMAGVVLYFLVRMEPFTSLHIKMQDGHLDIPDRLFNSVPGTWRLCTTAMSEVKELTPEFYYMPEFLVNHNSFNLGTSHTGERVGDVELPPWAKGSPDLFVAKMREALESDYVSDHLHLWIDLIFGHKARLPEAANADNVFYYLTYPGAVNIESIKDPALRLATELQIKHFGQCPMQLFSRPHPPRGALPRPPHPLGVTLCRKAGLIPSFLDDEATDDGNETGENSEAEKGKEDEPLHFDAETACWVSSDNGTVLAVRLIENRALCLFETGELCVYLWGRREGVDRRMSRQDSTSTVGSEQEAALPNPEFDASPLVLVPSPESIEAQANALEAGLPVSSLDPNVCFPVHTLPLSSVRRKLKAAARAGLSQHVPFAWSRDGSLLAHAGHAIGSVELYFVDTDSGHLRTWSASVVAHFNDVTALAIQGTTLMTGSEDGSVRVWDLLDTSGPSKEWGVAACPRLSLAGHLVPIKSLAVAETQGLLVSASGDFCLVHMLCSGKLLGALQGLSGEVIEFVRVSDSSGKILVFTASNKLFLFKTSLVGSAPLAVVETEQPIVDVIFSKTDLNSGSQELILCAGTNSVVSVRLAECGLPLLATFEAWPQRVHHQVAKNGSVALTSMSLNLSEEALLVGGRDGSLCILPMPNFVESGPDVFIPIVGNLDVSAKLASAKNAVLNKIDKNKVLATARGVATEAVGVAAKIAKGFTSVFGGQKS